MNAKFYDLSDELENVKRHVYLLRYEMSENNNQDAFYHMAEAFFLLHKAAEEIREARMAVKE